MCNTISNPLILVANLFHYYFRRKTKRPPQTKASRPRQGFKGKKQFSIGLWFGLIFSNLEPLGNLPDWWRRIGLFVSAIRPQSLAGRNQSSHRRHTCTLAATFCCREQDGLCRAENLAIISINPFPARSMVLTPRHKTFGHCNLQRTMEFTGGKRYHVTFSI